MRKWIFCLSAVSIFGQAAAIDVNPSKERLQPQRGPRPYLFQGDPRKLDRANTVQLRDVIVNLALGSDVVRAGQSLEVSLSVFNRSRRPIMVIFPDSQRLEAAVVSATGEEVFLLSSEMNFEAVPGTTVINPRERAVFNARLPVAGWAGGVRPGRYRVVGAVAGYPHVQASAYLDVR